MSDVGCLSATESRKLWHRRKVAQGVLGLLFIGIVVCLFALGEENKELQFLLCLALAAIMCLVQYWGTRCPRCGRSVYGPPPVDPNAPNPAEFGLELGPLLPYQCRTCGVCLWPSETDDRASETNGSQATDPAEPGATPDA